MPNEVTAETRQVPEVVKFRAQLEDRGRELEMALPSHITPEKFQRTVITAAMQNPDLLTADRQSLVLACMKAAQDGLLPDGREAALVTFNTRKKDGAQWKTVKLAQYMPMVYGLRKKILQSGEISTLEVGVVYRAELEAGRFLYEVGNENPLRYRPSFTLTEDDVTDDKIVLAFSMATMKDGTRSYDVMRRFEIDKVRQMSQTGAVGQTVKFGDNKGDSIAPKGPWVDWFAEMAKKTVMRRHAKTLPQSGDIVVDIEGDALDRSASTARALATEPDAPLIEDRTDELPPHDAETGELTDEGGEQADDKPKRARRTKAEMEAARGAEQQDTQGEPGTAREASGPSSSGDATSDSVSSPPVTEPEPEPEPEQDEATGMSKHPGESRADELLGIFRAATTVIDLNKHYNEAQLDIASLPDEIADVVEASYARELKRLQGGRVSA